MPTRPLSSVRAGQWVRFLKAPSLRIGSLDRYLHAVDAGILSAYAVVHGFREPLSLDMPPQVSPELFRVHPGLDAGSRRFLDLL